MTAGEVASVDGRMHHTSRVAAVASRNQGRVSDGGKWGHQYSK